MIARGTNCADSAVVTRRRFAPLLLALIAASGLAACFKSVDEHKETESEVVSREAESHGQVALPPPIARDLPAIQQRDTLVALLTFNSTTYFLYRAEPLGYEYELLKAYAAEHDLVLKTKLVLSIDSMFVMLNRGEGDIVAARLIPQAGDSGRVSYSSALYLAAPSLVQRVEDPRVAATKLPAAVDTVVKQAAPPVAGAVTVEAKAIEKPVELRNRKVTLPPRSPFRETLLELEDSIGDISVVELKAGASTETLIRDVARGAVQYTVADSNLAKLQEGVFTNISIRPVLGRQRSVAWAVRRNAPQLQQSINQWLADPKTKSRLSLLYRKYFIDSRSYAERADAKYLTSVTRSLSEYDGLFRFYAPKIGWDWRLLASQAYQESRFKSDAKSWAGARGLMQVMPATGRQYGVTRLDDPEENLRAAAKYLEWLTSYWSKHVGDPGERLKFILASYNVGLGHVEDAQRLALANGHNDHFWNDVAYWLLQLSKREYYTQPVVKYGYARGIEPVQYVSIILDRYEHYRQFVVDSAVVGSVSTPSGVVPLEKALRVRDSGVVPLGKVLRGHGLD